MPPPGHGTTGPTLAAPGMSTSTELNDAEFNDWFGDSPPNLLEFIDSDADALQSLEASRKAGRKGFLSPEPNVNFAPSATSADSPISPFQDSSSEDSLSTKRTRSTASAKTGLTSADTMMTDGPEVKQDYNVEDFLHVDDDEAFRYDGATINPRSIEQQFSMDDAAMENVFDFASATSSPSPNAQAAPTPETHIRHDAQHNSVGKAASPVEAKPANRRHNKALSQYSLTQSMNGLKTNGSREVSPASNFIFSQDSSPSAFFNNSPSPVMNIDFTHGGNMAMTADGIMPFTGVSPAQPPPGRPAPGMLMPNGIPAPLHFGMYPQQPMFGGQSPCKLTIDPIPLKSRVETQIPIKMRLSPLPPGIKRLHLPTHTISKPKLLAKPRAERSPDMLELSTMLVCTSAMQNPDLRRKALARAAAGIYPPPESSSGDDDETKPANGGEIWICKGCIQRERKRADRKKSKKPEEDETWRRNEHRRVIVFNTQEIKEWQNPAAMGHGAAAVEQMMEAAVDAPMRIACYCRHHGEKAGFQVIFTIKDCRDQVIAQAFSASIMITDDHKTHTLPPGMGATSTSNTSETSLVQQQSLATTPENSALSPGNSFRVSQSTSDLTSLKRQSSTLAPGAASQNGSAGPTPRNLSRPASPTSSSGPSTKKRKSSGSTKVPSGLAMTRLETAQAPASQAPNGQPSAAVSKATSPFSPNIAGFAPEQIFAQQSTSPANLTQPFTTGPPTPNSNNDQMFFSNNNRSASMDNLAMTQLYSAPTSTHPSRAPSPNGLRNAATAAQQQAQITQALQTNLFSMPLGMPQAPQAPSIIHKIIPGEGPKSGGIEVTILGIGFYQGLDVMFGDQKATTTTFWGERSLVCLVPPSPTAGHVLVTLKQSNGQPASPFPPNQQRITFKYIDDDEQHLLRTALTVLSKKMTGRFEDAQEVARRIIGTDTSSWGTSSGPAGGSSGGNYTGYSASGVNYESKLLKILELIDLDDSANKAYYNLCRKKTGQTMLHLACALGMHRFVAGLLARGAHPDVRDRCGYTPMHLAALNNQPEIVRRLIMAGADPTIRTLSGLTVAELAPSREVLLVIRRIERHARSRSGGSIHSRASSATSLKSLWEPPASQLAAGEYATNDSESADESPEYSENATTEDESSDEEHDEWLHMRRGSTQGRRSQDSKPAPLMPATDDHVAAGLGSPAATMMAFKDHFAAQIQQFQQAMALRVPNLPQFPYSLQMPHSWPESYQAYLNANPMFQRISSLVPNIGGGGSSRPGSAAENNSPSKEMESRWWDLSSLMPSSGAPPPSYEEIFPQKDLDTKQATAAGAAAEAEADSKCAALYDESVASGSSSPSSTSASVSSSASQLPALLQIGRKNAITKEQQDQFRRVHAEKRKGLDADRKLFFIWIPVLLLILCATLYSRLPAALSMASRLMPTVTFGRAVEGVQERVVEVLY